MGGDGQVDMDTAQHHTPTEDMVCLCFAVATALGEVIDAAHARARCWSVSYSLILMLILMGFVVVYSRRQVVLRLP